MFAVLVLSLDSVSTGNPIVNVAGYTPAPATVTVLGVAEVASYGCYPKRYSARLKFPREAIDLPILSRFSGHRGILKCRRIGDASTKAEAEAEAAG